MADLQEVCCAMNVPKFPKLLANPHQTLEDGTNQV